MSRRRRPRAPVRLAKAGPYRVKVWRHEEYPVAHFEIRRFWWHRDGGGWDVEADGTVRFDGCSNWSAGMGPMMHACDRATLGEFGDALQAAHRLAAEVLGEDWMGKESAP